jgi:hypothetical protein
LLLISYHLDPGGGAHDHHVGRTRRKQTDRHHACDLIESRFGLQRRGDGQSMYIDDVTAVVGDAALTPHRPATTLRQLAA